MTKAAFAPHQITQAQIKALHDNVLVADMEFDTRITQSGLILPNDNGTSLGIRPRWGRVYAIGKDQTNVKVGEWILVEHGRWTRGLEDDDENGDKVTIHRVDENGIMMSADEKPAGLERGVFTTAAHGSVHNPEDFVHMR
jgi:co-chaperonin GroES (HSP10)